MIEITVYVSSSISECLLLGPVRASGQNDWFMGEDNQGCDNS